MGLKRLLLRSLPAESKERIGLKLLRSASPEVRAMTDLFLPPSRSLGFFPPNWESGTGPAIYALYGLCRALRPEIVVETGSARGFSTCALALACRQKGKGKVYAIDPHSQDIEWNQSKGVDTYQFLLDRLRDYDLTPTWCEVIRATTAEA